MKRITWILVLLLVLGVSAARSKEPVVTVKPETITGSVTLVVAEEKMVYVKADNGIIYDFHVAATTKMTEGDQKLTFDDLASDVGKQIEVVFRPLKSGNMALSVAIR